MIDTQIKTLPEYLTVSGDLVLSGTPIYNLTENLTVGGSLDLSNTQVKNLPENLTIGGALVLSDPPIEYFVVGDSLKLNRTLIEKEEIKKIKRLKNGDYVPGRYLYADDILTHVKKTKLIGKYTVYVGKTKEKNVVSDGTYYAHCNKIRDGIADLLYKAAVDRGAEQYRSLSLEDEVTVEEAVTMYRVITGACRQGSETFVNSLGKLKEKYTVREIIEITKGQYNADKFSEYFYGI